MQAEKDTRERCEQCGVVLFSADPAPLCAHCWTSIVLAPPQIPSIELIQEIRALADPDRTDGRKFQVENVADPFAAAFTDTRIRKATIVADHRSRRARREAALRERNARRQRMVAVAICAMSALIMVGSSPAALSATAPPSPIHAGDPVVSRSADACITNLWTLMADRSEGRASSNRVVCPATREPYIYTQYKGITVISCPNPEAHSLTKLFVRSDTKVPVAQR